MNMKYEGVLIYNPELNEEEVSKEVQKVEATIKAHGGKVLSVDHWGKRELAYEIEKKKFGMYVLMVFDGDNTLIVELGRQLKINDAAMRFLLVKKDKRAPDYNVRAEDHEQGNAAKRDTETRAHNDHRKAAAR